MSDGSQSTIIRCSSINIFQAVRIEVEQQQSANLVAKLKRYDWQVASTTKHQISGQKILKKTSKDTITALLYITQYICFFRL